MHMTGHFASWMLVGWLAAAVQAPTATPHGESNATYELKITTRAEYPDGSDEARQIGEWLREHTESVNGKSIGDPTRLADLRVTYTATRRGDSTARAAVDSHTPPPVPRRGTPGDSIAITSVESDATRSWRYEWSEDGGEGRWDLTRYSFRRGSGPVPGPRDPD